MIPVQEQPESPDFSKMVREPGAAFIRQLSYPLNWKNRKYWLKALPDLHVVYHGICAYSAHWIPCITSVATVDHFIPKSIAPQLAYEWKNFRLCSPKFNSRKGEYQDVLDPFRLQPDWFILDFPSHFIKPNPNLSGSQKNQVLSTIKRLKLNDDYTCVQERLRWTLDFSEKHIDFKYLERNAPFIAYELQRQNLLETIASVMKV